MGNQSPISDDEFLKDAEEGLSAVTDKKRLSIIVDQLNRDLNKKLEKKKVKNHEKATISHYYYLRLNKDPLVI